ncbi:hypothetical protein KY314_02225 [Candidatus Woesearchaeota archaeon]|nr:hypothetical protein [Candidatus Woesearchaeota archaeon]
MGEDNLELKIQITEQDLDKSRKDFERAGLILHFGGELVGALYYMLFRGLALPCIQNILGYSDNLEPDYRSIALGLAVYAIPQIPAFFLKGLAMTQEENKALAEKLEAEAEETKNNIIAEIASRLTRKMSKMHYHFSNNYKRYDEIVQKYTIFKKQLFREFSTHS